MRNEEKHKEIATLLRAGHTVLDTVNLTSTSKSTVFKVKKLIEEGQDLKDKPRSGRPQKVQVSYEIVRELFHPPVCPLPTVSFLQPINACLCASCNKCWTVSQIQIGMRNGKLILIQVRILLNKKVVSFGDSDFDSYSHLLHIAIDLCSTPTDAAWSNCCTKHFHILVCMSAADCYLSATHFVQ